MPTSPHNPDDLLRLYHACAVERDLAIGSRYIKGVNVVNWPMGRVLMSYYASAYVRMITGMSVRDTTAGFNAIPAGCWKPWISTTSASPVMLSRLR